MTPPRPLRVVQSCAERWETMSSRAGGRHCAACDRVVLDLTGLTLAEARARLDRVRRENGAACGRASADAQTRELVFAPPPREPRSSRHVARTVLLAAALVSGCDADHRADPRPAPAAQLAPLTAPTPKAVDAGDPAPVDAGAADSQPASSTTQSPRHVRHHRRSAPRQIVDEVGYME